MKIWMIEHIVKPGYAVAVVSAISEDDAWEEVCQKINDTISGIGWKPIEGEKKKEYRKKYKITEIISETQKVFHIDTEWF